MSYRHRKTLHILPSFKAEKVSETFTKNVRFVRALIIVKDRTSKIEHYLAVTRDSY